mmetsp:Transcript_73101/g.219501  ORF Transcript_73101/g.219501 Transcript_73101/m.219501 type:complete len:131 (-) Transcript_73101:2678-3070(-)
MSSLRGDAHAGPVRRAVRSCFASSATCSKREDCGHGAREGGGKEACAKEGSGTSSCVRFGHFSFCFEALLLPFCRWRCALGSSSRCWQLGMRFNTVAQHSQVLRLLYKRMPFDLAHVIEIEEEQKLLDSV